MPESQTPRVNQLKPPKTESAKWQSPRREMREEETTIYLHLSRRHLSATGSPLDTLTTRGEGEQTQNAGPATGEGGRHRSLCRTVRLRPSGVRIIAISTR